MFAIAELTIRKLKEPAFMIMILFSMLVGFCLSGIDPVSEQDTTSILGQLMSAKKGYPIISGSFFSVALGIIVAIFAGASEIPRDIESRMILLLLSKPISKVEYLLGKFLGVFALCAIFFTVSELTIIVSHFFKAGQLLSFGIILKQFYLLMLLVPIVSISVCVSCFAEDLGAMIITVLYILFSASFSLVPLLVAMLPKSISGGIEVYLYLIYYFFPNFIYYFQSYHLFGLVSVSVFFYSISIAVIFLTIGAVKMNTRDMIP